MVLLKCIFIFVVGHLMENVLSYNPLLTYVIRFQKITFYGNISVNYTINKVKENEFINGKIHLYSEDIVDKVTVVFNRCNPEGVNCEYFQAWNFNDVCAILKDKNQIWSSWYESFYPRVPCPVKEVISEVKNGHIDIEPAIRWYPDCTNYHWKVTQKLYTLDNFVASYTFHLSIFGFRQRKTRPAKV